MEIDQVINNHGEGTVRQAFWLQEHIYKHGLEPANFMQVSEQTMESVKGRVIESELNRELPNRSI